MIQNRQRCFEVTQRVREVNFEVRWTDSRYALQIYNLKILKPWPILRGRSWNWIWTWKMQLNLSQSPVETALHHLRKQRLPLGPVILLAVLINLHVEHLKSLHRRVPQILLAWSFNSLLMSRSLMLLSHLYELSVCSLKWETVSESSRRIWCFHI